MRRGHSPGSFLDRGRVQRAVKLTLSHRYPPPGPHVSRPRGSPRHAHRLVQEDRRVRPLKFSRLSALRLRCASFWPAGWLSLLISVLGIRLVQTQLHFIPSHSKAASSYIIPCRLLMGSRAPVQSEVGTPYSNEFHSTHFHPILFPVDNYASPMRLIRGTRRCS